MRWKKCGNYAPPLLKFLATPLPSLVVDEENLVIGFGPPTLEMLPPSLYDLAVGARVLVRKAMSKFGKDCGNAKARSILWVLQTGR